MSSMREWIIVTFAAPAQAAADGSIPVYFLSLLRYLASRPSPAPISSTLAPKYSGELMIRANASYRGVSVERDKPCQWQLWSSHIIVRVVLIFLVRPCGTWAM